MPHSLNTASPSPPPTRPASPPARPSRSTLVSSLFSPRFAVPLLFALAAFLRFWHLGAESLWFDEGWTVRVTRLAPAAIVADAAADVHPPLYYFFMKVWTSLAGTGEWALRLPSVLFGLAALWALYRLGREMFGRRAAAIALLFAAASAFHVRYSQEARSYSLLAMLALFSAWTFWRFERRPSARSAAAYLAATIPLVYVHNFALFVVAAQWAYLAGLWVFSPPSRDRRRLLAWLGVQGLLGFTYLPWLGVLFSQVRMIRQGFWIPPITLKQIHYSFIDYAGTRPLLWLLAPLAIAALILHSRKTQNAKPQNAKPIPHSVIRNPQFFLALLILIPNLVPYAVSKLVAPMYTTKSTIYCAPLFLLLAASALAPLRPRLLRLGVVVSIAALSLAAVRAEDRLVRKEPWREAVRELEARAAPGDIILFNWGACLDNAYFYYSRRDDLQKIRFPDVAGWNWSIDEKAMAALEPQLAAHPRVWVVFCRSRDTKGLLIGRLRNACRETFHKFYPGYDEFIDVYLFEKP